MRQRSLAIDIVAAEGTCEWLFQHETYKSWVAHDRSLLWIKGKPGSGKSTLLRHVLDNILTETRDGGNVLVLSFFFHGRGTELQKIPLGLFRVLLYQLLDQVPDALSSLVDTFKRHRDIYGEPGKDWQWDLGELQPMFKSSLAKVLANQSVWLFIDALDECGEETAVSLIKEFKFLLGGKLPSTCLPFRICFTCRQYPILDLDLGFEITVDLENGEDISKYVRNQLSTHGESTHGDSEAHEIPARILTTIVDHDRDVFMWTCLVVERVLKLRRGGHEWPYIETTIHKIPPGLNSLYRLINKEGVGADADSLKLIQWVCCAIRPLLLDEVRWAMTIDAGCQYRSLQECQDAKNYASDSKLIEMRLITLGCGLVEVVESSNSQIVQFMHHSVKEFFVQEGLSKLTTNLNLNPAKTDTSSSMSVVETAQHRLSRICLKYLAMDEIHRSSIRDLSRQRFPFLHYATTSWIMHAKQSDRPDVPQDDLLDDLGWPSESLANLWVRASRAVS